METMTETGTEKRVDELSERVNFGFEQVDKHFEQVDDRFDRFEGRVDRGFDKVDADIRETRGEIQTVRTEMKSGFRDVDAKLDSLNRTIIYLLGGSLSVVTGGLIAAAFHLIS
jgi:hypothetical protein